MEIIKYYFPYLSKQQIEQFTALKFLYEYWNTKINVISRKSISNLYINHVLHSLAIAKVINFKSETKILDLGTGGGFPGIPLAILFPQANFVLIDSIGKKIKVVNEVINKTQITNVKTIHQRAENYNDSFDFIICRAVTNMNEFQKWVEYKFYKQQKNKLQNGILYLKGGDLSEELKGIKHFKYEISKFFKEDFFKTKKVIYIPY
tara:strand:- start:971 stop:1585 length:615 start_codon:yes stop_codon:yes gene_type:complete